MYFEKLHKVCLLIESSRLRATRDGDYIGAISDHEHALKLIRSILQSCDDKNYEKIENLMGRTQLELRILNELSRELITFPSGGSELNRDLSQIDDINVNHDPDVWPPPTPVNQNRDRIESNTPSWAMGREAESKRGLNVNNNNNQASAITNNRRHYQQQQQQQQIAKKTPDDAMRIDRLRRERDAMAAPSRKKYPHKYISPPLISSNFLYKNNQSNIIMFKQYEAFRCRAAKAS